MTTPLVELEAPKPKETALARGLAVFTVLILLFGLVGLVTVDPDDGSLPEGTPLAIVASAADKTFAGTARVAMTSELSFGGQGGMTMTGEGTADFEAERLVMTMKAAGLFEMEIRSDGKTVYMKVPKTGSFGGPPTPWVAFDVDEFKPSGADRLGASPTSGGNPGAFLEMLTEHDAVKSVTPIGETNVRGVATTGYRVVLDMAKLADDFGVDEEVDFSQAEVVQEAYVDADGRVRRAVVRFGPPAEEGEAAPIGMTISMDFYDFGVDVEVRPPPSEEVTRLDSIEDLDSIMGG